MATSSKQAGDHVACVIFVRHMNQGEYEIERRYREFDALVNTRPAQRGATAVQACAG